MTPPPLRVAIDAFRANDVATVLRTAGVVDMPKTKDGKTDLWDKLIGDPGRIRIALGRINAALPEGAATAATGRRRSPHRTISRVAAACRGLERRAKTKANGHLRLLQPAS